MSRVTMKQIAEKAGTSIGTVDRALSNRDGINKETKEKVLKIAEELGYEKNNLASILSKKKVTNIGIVYAREPKEFYMYFDKAVDKALEDFKDYNLNIEKLTSNSLSPDEQIKLLKSIDIKKYDGIGISSAGPLSKDYINKFSELNIPVVTFNSDIEDSNRLLFVGNNGYESGSIAAELLSNFINFSGKIGVIGNFINTNTFVKRFGGFNDFIQKNYPSIQVDLWSQCNSDPSKACEIAMKMIKMDPNINGLYATGYSSTVGLIKAKGKLNRPDIKLVGYDISHEILDALEKGLCNGVIFQDPFQQTYQSIKLLLKIIIEDWKPEKEKLYVESKIVLYSNAHYYAR